MRLETKLFRTRVARRIVTLFIICAVVPISALAIISFGQVRHQINAQSREHFSQETKAMSVSLTERLRFFEAELQAVASGLYPLSERDDNNVDSDIEPELDSRFVRLALMDGKGTYTPLVGDDGSFPEIGEEEKERIHSGKPLLTYQARSHLVTHMFMGIAFVPGKPERGILVAEINPSRLWEAADRRPAVSDLIVIDRSNTILFSSLPKKQTFNADFLQKMAFSHSGYFEWTLRSEKYFASYVAVFLQSNFMAPEWVIILTKSKAEVFQPMTDFVRLFPMVVILSLLVVLFLSAGLIRKNMGPIQILRAGTLKIAQGAFGYKVDIDSGDEFEALGQSFNEMSQKLKETQELLVRAAKMSTMGQMASGMVHEIKQPLTAIYGLLETTMMEQIPERAQKRLEKTLGAVERLDGILNKFRAFSISSEATLEEVSLEEAVDEVCDLLQHQLDMKQINCQVEKGEALPHIMGDSQELQQVLSNLVMNAADALENRKNGDRKVVIRTYASDDKVFLEVQDNGEGIPEAIRQRIFDPFFTTKSAEKGTGLGMAIVESILHKHHSSIEVESDVGVGTTFKIAFPSQ